MCPIHSTGAQCAGAVLYLEHAHCHPARSSASAEGAVSAVEDFLLRRNILSAPVKHPQNPLCCSADSIGGFTFEIREIVPEDIQRGRFAARNLKPNFTLRSNRDTRFVSTGETIGRFTIRVTGKAPRHTMGKPWKCGDCGMEFIFPVCAGNSSTYSHQGETVHLLSVWEGIYCFIQPADTAASSHRGDAIHLLSVSARIHRFIQPADTPGGSH
ncbi:uncharacterized protein LOC119960640 [Scyliorhinus canicula]|uniref:uncharacterized protein LOC119960640 n=1 Tax=Scyliorhinus canicula TaxID=7830 RepID=UPI0018F5D4D0|nr:uncharacterized protein LOC119960640 [Scyliorhinus canicula]